MEISGIKEYDIIIISIVKTLVDNPDKTQDIEYTKSQKFLKK